jgi:hypothetical protein
VSDSHRSWEVGANDQTFKASDYAPLVVAYHDGSAVRISDIGQAQAVRSENACKGELRKGVRIVAATELFFFDRSKDIVVIEERNRCAGAWSGDAEGVHAADFRGVRSRWRLMAALQTPG